jgi:hypothetical protein
MFKRALANQLEKREAKSVEAAKTIPIEGRPPRNPQEHE